MSTSQADFSRLRSAHDTLLDAPGVGKVEIAHGQILPTLPPNERHEAAVRRIATQLDAQLPRTHPGFRTRPDAVLEVASMGAVLRPDLAVVAGRSPATSPPHRVLLVAEVVSKADPKNDYLNKVRNYSAMGIPFYLLVDPRTGTGIVYSEPRYESREKFAFGDTVAVGPWALDTSGLLTYA